MRNRRSGSVLPITAQSKATRTFGAQVERTDYSSQSPREGALARCRCTTGGTRAPSRVAGAAGVRVAHKLQARTRSIGAPQLWTSAPRGVRIGPSHARPGIVLLRRRVERPLWVIQVRASQSAQIRPARQQQSVHIVVRRDRARPPAPRFPAPGCGSHPQTASGRTGRTPAAPRSPPGPSRRRPRPPRARRTLSRSPAPPPCPHRRGASPSPRSARSSADPRATPPVRPRTPPTDIAAGWPGHLHTHPYADSSTGTGSSTADSRARSAAPAGRSRPGLPARPPPRTRPGSPPSRPDVSSRGHLPVRAVRQR